MVEGSKARFDVGGDTKKQLQKDFGWKEDADAKWEDQYDVTKSPMKEIDAMGKK